MNIETFRVLTPFITLSLAIGVGAIGWFVRRFIDETKSCLTDLKIDISKQLDKVEADIEKIETARASDQKYLYEHCLQKEVFYMTIGETKGLIGKIFDELTEVNRLVNRTIGSLTSRYGAEPEE